MGVSPNCSEEELKRAYKKLAVQFHPDRNPNGAEMFKKISHAYSVLIEPRTRQIYDRYGEQGVQQMGNEDHGPTSAEDLFASLLGMRMGGGGGGGGDDEDDVLRGNRRLKKGDPLVIDIEVTLEEIYNSATRKETINRMRCCESCNGQGSTKPGVIKPCRTCDGIGMRVQLLQMGPFVQQQRVECDDCEATGIFVANRDKKFLCSQCSGKRLTKQSKTLEVFIDKGIKHNDKIVVDGEADDEFATQRGGGGGGFNERVPPGDVIFVVKQKSHDTFERDGNNLILKKKISLTECLTGVDIQLTHLDGSPFVLRSHPGQILKPSSVRTVQGLGMPLHKMPFEKGDLIVQIDVEFPELLDAALVAELERILPQRTKIAPNEHVEELVLEVASENYSANGRRSKKTAADAHRQAFFSMMGGGGGDEDESKADADGDNDEDEDEEDGGGPRVACAQQ